jgi:hypothetical protein
MLIKAVSPVEFLPTVVTLILSAYLVTHPCSAFWAMWSLGRFLLFETWSLP